MTFRNRGYLPHLELPDSTFFVTFRLAGTLPQTILASFKEERHLLSNIAQEQNRRLTLAEEARLKYLETKKIQDYLDKGIGDCWLKVPAIAEIIKQAILFFHGSRYINHAFCIMPNHVHWLVTPGGASTNDSKLITIMHSIKSFTAHQVNKQLQRTGSIWSKEYYDHLVRSSEEFGRLLVYTFENPVKAGLCKEWQDWPWTVCSKSISDALDGSD